MVSLVPEPPTVRYSMHFVSFFVSNCNLSKYPTKHQHTSLAIRNERIHCVNNIRASNDAFAMVLT